MKKNILSLIALVCIATFSFAQGKPAPPVKSQKSSDSNFSKQQAHAASTQKTAATKPATPPSAKPKPATPPPPPKKG